MCELTVSYCCHLNVLLRYTIREIYNYWHCWYSRKLGLTRMSFFMRLIVWCQCVLWGNDVDMVKEHKFSYFKYILLYCKIQNNNKAFLFTNVQNSRLYYILAINKKNFVQSSLIQYKNMNVSYKLLHFAAAVHWRLPSPFISVHLI